MQTSTIEQEEEEEEKKNEEHSSTQTNQNETTEISLDPLLLSSNLNQIQNHNQQQDQQQQQQQEQPPTTTTLTELEIEQIFSNQEHPQVITLPKLPKSKITQCNHLKQCAEIVLNSIWKAIDLVSSRTEGENEQEQDGFTRLGVSHQLDGLLGDLHQAASPFKLSELALIWPQCITHKSVQSHYHSSLTSASTSSTSTANRASLVHYSIRKANLAFLIECVLYSIEGQDGYGKNDLVYACEGFLPLVVVELDQVLEEESWRLFNQLKIQIYIQRLDQTGKEETNLKVLPNLFVESLTSYSGLEIPRLIEAEFECLSLRTKQELIDLDGDLKVLKERYPYLTFIKSLLDYLRKGYNRLEEQELKSKQLEAISDDQVDSNQNGTCGRKKKRKRKTTEDYNSKTIEHLSKDVGCSETSFVIDHELVSSQRDGDIHVEQGEEGDDLNPDQLQSTSRSNRYNPYRLGRGKGAAVAPRRRWTQEEYELLLEEVRLHSNKYDCMAQIIKRHGKNGELSETFKDQNNVSLKDKARNLTMEWSRHGYPDDKPWLKEAFARFSVKSTTSTNQTNQNSIIANEIGVLSHSQDEDSSSPCFDLMIQQPNHLIEFQNATLSAFDHPSQPKQDDIGVEIRPPEILFDPTLL